MVAKASVTFMPHMAYWNTTDKKVEAPVWFYNNVEGLFTFIDEYLYAYPQEVKLEPASLAAVPLNWQARVQHAVFRKVDDETEWKLVGWFSAMPDAWPLPPFIPAPN